jgi:hypothetical protein
MGKARLRDISVAAGLALAATFVFADGAGAVVSHASHRAFYEISMGRVDIGSSIVDARGRMVAEWRRGCDGWESNQRLQVSMSPGEGDPINSEVSAKNFETHDGRHYTFDTETRIGGEIVEHARGVAERPGPGAPGRAVYDVPRGTVLDLPADTLFPYQHTIVVLDAAERGAFREFGHYFDGSQPDISPMEANSLILGKARDPKDGLAKDFGAASAHKWWPIRLAMFPRADRRQAGETQPEFEMTQVLQDNGVVRRFEFDYGDFSLVAELVDLELFDPPTCN